MTEQELLEAVRKYIEWAEVKINSEWGSTYSLEKLIAMNEMPEIYGEILKRIELLDKGDRSKPKR
jgi:hypothetical protein